MRETFAESVKDNNYDEMWSFLVRQNKVINIKKIRHNEKSVEQGDDNKK